MNFSNARESMRSPLAKKLFQIDGVTGVFFGRDFVTVTKSETFDWEVLKPEVYAKIMDFYASGEPVVDIDDGTSSSSSSSSSSNGEDVDDPNKILDTDSETVAMIKELLETRIKPAVAEDGGDIAFKKFDEADGLVYVELRGACDGCPSSTVTLKSGIENMLMHYVPEVKGVVPWEGDKEMDLLDMADLMRGR
jgi:Fe-S cluster biogenesis protein NfuA